MDKEKLMDYAKAARNRAYVPYSNFPVGAAFLMKDGRVTVGVNVENASFGATNCAERSAVFNAITAGYKRGAFGALAIAGKTEDFLPPCGVCRQVMVEFCDADMPVYLLNGDDEIKELKLHELVPYTFDSLDI